MQPPARPVQSLLQLEADVQDHRLAVADETVALARWTPRLIQSKAEHLGRFSDSLGELTHALLCTHVLS